MAAHDGSTRRKGYLPSFLRCTRVRRSSLRCFFFDIRLRRFLITEPITPLSVLDCPTPRQGAARPASSSCCVAARVRRGRAYAITRTLYLAGQVEHQSRCRWAEMAHRRDRTAARHKPLRCVAACPRDGLSVGAGIAVPTPVRLASVEVRGLQHVVHCLRVHAERPADADRGQFTVVNQPIDRHLADPHQCCHLCNRQELRPGLLAVYGTRVSSRFTASRWPVHRRHRNPISQAPAVPAASPPLAPTGAYQQGE